MHAGSAVANYSTATQPNVLKFPINLISTVSSPSMTASCREQYRLALLNDLLNLTRTINYRICTGDMCPYLAGAPGSGVNVAKTGSLSPHVVFAAINTNALTNPILFNVVTSTVSKNKRPKYFGDSRIEALFAIGG